MHLAAGFASCHGDPLTVIFPSLFRANTTAKCFVNISLGRTKTLGIRLSPRKLFHIYPSRLPEKQKCKQTTWYGMKNAGAVGSATRGYEIEFHIWCLSKQMEARMRGESAEKLVLFFYFIFIKTYDAWDRKAKRVRCDDDVCSRAFPRNCRWNRTVGFLRFLL